MKLTVEQLKELKPCTDGFEWYVKNIKTEEIREILLQLNRHKPEWARWLFKKLTTKDQSVKIAIFSAELVLHIFEEEYPKDNRPRKAIEAAKEYLSKLNNHDAAAAAYAAAAYAADAAYAAAAYAAAAYAADAAAAYAAAADAAAAAAYAADAAYAAAADAAAAAAYAADAAGYAAYASKNKVNDKILNYVADLLE